MVGDAVWPRPFCLSATAHDTIYHNNLLSTLSADRQTAFTTHGGSEQVHHFTHGQ